MKQYFNVADNRCPSCGGDVSIYNTVHLGEHVRVDSFCKKCGHTLMALYHIVSIVDDDATEEDNGKVLAEVMHEVWMRDYANYVDSEYFDCSKALDEFELNVLPPDADGFSEGWCSWGDDVFFCAAAQGLAKRWDGPFTFVVTDTDAYDEYIRRRVLNEYGKELRG